MFFFIIFLNIFFYYSEKSVGSDLKKFYSAIVLSYAIMYKRP